VFETNDGEGGIMISFRKGIVSLALAGSFILGVGAISTASAQDWRWQRQRQIEQQRRWEQIQRQREIERQQRRNYGYYGDRNRNGVNDRYEIDRNRNGVADAYEYGRNGRNNGYYGNGGYYGNRGYGVNDYEYQKGYRDGLNRGREDAQTNRAMTPNNSSHYRSGNQSYRSGFERGFYEAYRQYSGRRW
jgi:hypothetical protein